MLFGGIELVRRIERAECELLRDCVDGVARARGDAFVLPIAGGVAAFAGADAPMTRVVGLGFDGAPKDDELARVEAEFGARGAAVQIELATLAEAGISERLSARGYALLGFENVLARALDPAERFPARAGIEVDRTPPEDLERWLDLVVDGFATPDEQGVASHESFPRDALRRVMRDVASARGFDLYTARRAGVAAGGASLHLGDGVVHLSGAATLPEHRRRGVQGALLERRLADAARTGRDLAVVITLPGSKSQENAQRRGFELVFARAIRRLPAPGARS